MMRFIPWMLMLLLSTTSSFANTDVVTFANGNKLIGEFKSLDRGKMSFDTDATGVVQIDWDEVTSLVTEQTLQIEIFNAYRYLGSLMESDTEGMLAIDTADGNREITFKSIVKMDPIGVEYKDRFDIAVRTGYNFTKASDVGQFSLGVDIDYRTEKRRIGLDFTSVITNNIGETTDRHDLAVVLQALRRDRWFTAGLFKLQTNEELDIDLRTSFGGGIGRTLRETGTNRIEFTAGLLLTNEKFVDPEGPEMPVEPDTLVEDDTHVEGLFALTFDWFRFKSPDLDIQSSLAVFPGITDSGRLRAEFDLTFRWEMVEDLFWEMNYYDNYDSGSENATDSANDYGVITSIGYKF